MPICDVDVEAFVDFTSEPLGWLVDRIKQVCSSSVARGGEAKG